MRKMVPIVVLSILLTVSIFTIAMAEDEATKPEEVSFQEPVTIVSLGQSPGAVIAKVLFQQAGIEFTYLEEREISAFTDNLPNTFVPVLGASNKGLGAAGIKIEEEISWGNELFDVAEENSIPILLMHVEGEARRGDISDQLINHFAPEADLVIIKESADKDNIFTDLCSENDIPLVSKEKGLDIVPELEELFNQ